MANQMIALQARNPQLPDPQQRTARLANVMNAARQAEAAQLQGERIRQEMEYAQAGENRAQETQRLNVRKEDQAFRVAGMTELRNRGVGVLQSGSEDAYQLWLRQADAIDPDSAAVMRQIAPTFNKDAMTFAITKADEFIANNTSKRRTEIIYDKNGFPIEVKTGGNTDYEATPVVVTNIRDVNQPPRATPATPTAPPVAVGTGADMRATQGSNTTPQDLIDQGMDPNNIPSGIPTSPASFTGMGAPAAAQMTPERAQQIVDSAVRSRVMAQEDFDQLMALAPEQNKQAFTDMIRTNNITLQPGGMGQQPQFAVNQGQRPQADFAVNRNAPFEDTLAQYIPVQRRDPNVSPYPGSAQVAPNVLAAQEAAKAQATKNVDLRMAPQIATATKKVESAAALKSEAPSALRATKNVVAGLDDYIDTIDRLLRSPDRSAIVGRFEGRIPYVLQDERQAELQADFDKIKNTDTLTSLVEMKQASPTGGSPVGNASNQDVLLVARGANSLVQTGGVSKFDQELKNIRRQAYRARQTAIEEYNNRYGELAASDPRFKLVPRATADRYISTKDLPQNKTPVIPTLTPEQVRANPNIKRWKRADNGQIMVRK